MRALGARDVLELGTSNGVSTVWLAEALAATGGRLVSVELDAGRSRAAGENLERAGLDGVVELRTGDAADALRDSPDDAWDVVFLDAERPQYPGYWPDLARVIRPGGLIAADNAISHADQMQPFRDVVEADPRTTTALDATGAGILLVLMTRLVLEDVFELVDHRSVVAPGARAHRVEPHDRPARVASAGRRSRARHGRCGR